MSGIYIPNWEKPKSCRDCFACHDGWCVINQKIEGHRTVTHSCPLIEVPPHGRLIDADVVEKEIERYEKISGYPVGEEPKEFTGDDGWETVRYTAWMARCFIAEQNAPTIIPAEEGE